MASFHEAIYHSESALCVEIRRNCKQGSLNALHCFKTCFNVCGLPRTLVVSVRGAGNRELSLGIAFHNETLELLSNNSAVFFRALKSSLSNSTIVPLVSAQVIRVAPLTQDGLFGGQSLVKHVSSYLSFG
jgi:hypothetical protein